MIYGNYAYPHNSSRSARRTNLSAVPPHNSYKLRVMPYNDLREGFEFTTASSSSIAIYVLIAIIAMLYVLALYLATRTSTTSYPSYGGYGYAYTY